VRILGTAGSRIQLGIGECAVVFERGVSEPIGVVGLAHDLLPSNSLEFDITPFRVSHYFNNVSLAVGSRSAHADGAEFSHRQLANVVEFALARGSGAVRSLVDLVHRLLSIKPANGSIRSLCGLRDVERESVSAKVIMHSVIDDVRDEPFASEKEVARASAENMVDVCRYARQTTTHFLDLCVRKAATIGALVRLLSAVPGHDLLHSSQRGSSNRRCGHNGSTLSPPL
jgi:hypothetical protein